MAKKTNKLTRKEAINSRKTIKKAATKAAKKAVKKTPAKKQSKKKMYESESERTPYKLKWLAEKAERERLAFLEYYDEKYPLKNKKKPPKK